MRIFVALKLIWEQESKNIRTVRKVMPSIVSIALVKPLEEVTKELEALKKKSKRARIEIPPEKKMYERNWLSGQNFLTPFRPPHPEPERKGRLQSFLWRQIL